MCEKAIKYYIIDHCNNLCIYAKLSNITTAKGLCYKLLKKVWFHYIALTDLELKETCQPLPLPPEFWVMGLKVCTTMPSQNILVH